MHYLLQPVVMMVIGAATVAAYAPLAWYPLAWLTLGGLFATWRTAAPGRAALNGWFFGLGLYLAGVSWVYVSMHDFGGMPAVLAAIATLGFCAYLALYPALAGWMCARCAPKSGWGFAICAAGAWTIAEWLRGVLLTGFPWLALGYAQAPPSPLAGFAPLGGVAGLSLLTAAIGALLAVSWRERPALLRAGAVLAVIVVAGYALGGLAWTRPASQAVTVSLLQGNIEQSLKWRPERLIESMSTYLELARRYPADLVVLPETALPTTLDQLDPEYIGAMRAAAGGEVLAGLVVNAGPGRYLNSVVALGRAGVRYDKQHLVPFGEFTPPLFSWTLALLHIPMSDFSRGSAQQAPLFLAGEQLAINVCYEDIFGDELRVALPAASLLVNVSNTAWFGHSWAQPQHLQMAQLRALESGRWMLRATNTGMTAAIDPRGNVVAALPPFAAGGLRLEVAGHAGATPYARWGDWPVLGLSLVILGACWWRRTR